MIQVERVRQGQERDVVIFLLSPFQAERDEYTPDFRKGGSRKYKGQ